MSRALASVPVRQFGNSPARRHAVQLMLPRTPCMGASIQYLIPSRPGEFGANASGTPVWQARL